MPNEWYYQAGRVQGPLPVDALLDLIECGRLSWNAPVAPAGASGFRPANDWDGLTLRSAERNEQATRHPAAAVVELPPPPPGEPWFHPVSAMTVGLLDVATLGLYTLIWSYQHRRWALQRTGRPISTVWSVIRGPFPLEIYVARAAEQVGVRRSFSFYGDPPAPVAWLMLLLLPVWLPLAIAHNDVGVQLTANRVNRKVAPGRDVPLMGWLEVAVLLVLAWVGAFGLLLARL